MVGLVIESVCVCLVGVQWMSAVVHVNRYVCWVENVGRVESGRDAYRNNHIMASFSCMMMMMVWFTVKPKDEIERWNGLLYMRDHYRRDKCVTPEQL